MRQFKKNLTKLGVMLASGVFTCGVAQAQTGAGTPEQNPPGAVAEAPAKANTLDVHGLFGVDFTTHYISRGLVLEDQGVIGQPYGELGFTVFEGDGAISKATLFGGIWNSLHSEHTDALDASTTPAWYEFDWYFGLSTDFAEKFNLNLSYWEFISPSEGFGTSKNVQAKLSYNDAGMWGGGDGGFALKPYGIVFFETNGKAGSGSDEGVYFEFGVEPTVYTFAEEGDMPVAISVPVKIGLGANDFYEDDENFGFATAGLKASVPLAFMGDRYGAWSGYAGVYYYMYGDGVDDFNEGTGDGNDDIVGALGVSMAF